MLLQTILTNETSLNLGILFALLVLSSAAYNRYVVEWMENKGYDGWTWLQVAIGVAMTIGFGWLIYGWQFACQMFFLFVASGTPMIVGAIWRREQRIKRAIEMAKDGE